MVRRPRSVLLAAVVLLLAFVVQLGLIIYFGYFVGAGLRVGWGQYLFASAFFALLLWGIVGGYRLAWLWGRYLAIFLGGLVLVVTLLRWRTGTAPSLSVSIALGGLVAMMFAAGWALGRPDSLRFFGLICPICHAEARRNVDLLFKQAQCPKCGHIW